MLMTFYIDLDDITEKMVMQYLRLIKRIGKWRILQLCYRLSSGGHGYHIRIAMDIPESFKETIKDFDSFKLGLRYLFLDCYGRLKTDIARLYLGQEMDRLAIYKDGKYAGQWKTFYTRKSLPKLHGKIQRKTG